MPPVALIARMPSSEARTQVRSARHGRRSSPPHQRCGPIFRENFTLLAFFGGGEKFRSIEKAVRTVEYGDENGSVRSMRDMDVAARPPHEVTCCNAALGVFQRSFEHEGLFERRVLV